MDPSRCTVNHRGVPDSKQLRKEIAALRKTIRANELSLKEARVFLSQLEKLMKDSMRKQRGSGVR